MQQLAMHFSNVSLPCCRLWQQHYYYDYRFDLPKKSLKHTEAAQMANNNGTTQTPSQW